MGNKKIGGLGIEIKKLYKIFGPNGANCVKLIERGVTKTELNAKHGHVLGLKDINISMPAGGIQVIMGLSGSGKSTLIRHINRLIDPTSGEVVIGDEDVVKMDAVQLREFRRHQTAMVFQKFALLPHRTVLENTLYGLEIQGAPRSRQVDCAMRWIERVGLDHVKSQMLDQPEAIRKLAARFRISQKYSQDDPWAQRASGDRKDLHQHLAEFRPLVVENA